MLTTSARSVFVDSVEYRDRTYGNTYTATVVYVDGKSVASVPMGYGHGDTMAGHNAMRALIRLGIVTTDGDYVPPLWYLRDQCGVHVYRATRPGTRRQCESHGRCPVEYLPALDALSVTQ